MPSWRLTHPSTRVGYWPLNGNALDVSGHGNRGTWGGTEAYSTFLTGRQCGVFGGDGTDTRIDVAAAQDLQGATVAMWARRTNTANFNYLWDDGGSTGGTNYARIANASNIILRVPGTAIVYVDGIPTTTFTPGTWHHVAVVGLDIVGDAFVLGGYRSGVAFEWIGEICDARMYNVDLSRDEVIQIIHAPVPHLAG